MENPWKAVALTDYENHMRMADVYQLQTLNGMMKEQFCSFDAESVMILGIAGGNGLEHVDDEKFKTVYGVDVNPDYLAVCRQRYPNLEKVLKPICADLTDKELHLPGAVLLIANLLVEYIGYECFQQVVKKVKPLYVSCVIQINRAAAFVSDSPYLHAFDGLSSVHHQIEESKLIASMQEIDYAITKKQERDLPNGKQFVRIDFAAKESSR